MPLPTPSSPSKPSPELAARTAIVVSVLDRIKVDASLALATLRDAAHPQRVRVTGQIKEIQNLATYAKCRLTERRGVEDLPPKASKRLLWRHGPRGQEED